MSGIRTLGIVLLAVGVFAFVGGVAAAIVGFTTQTEGDDEGMFGGGEEAAGTKQDLQTYGVVAAIAGVVLGVLGAVLRGMGSRGVAA